MAAFVLEVLHANAIVVHDVNARGDGKLTQHQLDVQVECGGRERRVIVECRDFDTGKVTQAQALKVGSTIRQLDADGLIITNTSFPRGAKCYASDEGIALAELRPAIDEDMQGRIRTVGITLNFVSQRQQ